LVEAYVISECNEIASESIRKSAIGNECINCKSIEYCSPYLDNDFEWIDKINIGKFTYQSGKNTDGYGNFSHSPSINLISGGDYTLNVELKFDDIVYSDTIFVWLDLNHNGSFDKNELLDKVSNNNTNQVEMKFKIPESDYSGETRLRIVLSSENNDEPCEFTDNDYGEFEDYCVFLSKENSCNISNVNLKTEKSENNWVKLSWDKQQNAFGYLIGIISQVYPDDFKELTFVKDTSLIFLNLDTCTVYDVSLNVYCDDVSVSEEFAYSFKTECGNGIDENKLGDFTIFPNPTERFINISSGTNSTGVAIYDLFGREIFRKTGISTEYSVDLNLYCPNKGVYLLEVNENNKQSHFKLIKN
jgi:hypothetical protein